MSARRGRRCVSRRVKRAYLLLYYWTCYRPHVYYQWDTQMSFLLEWLFRCCALFFFFFSGRHALLLSASLRFPFALYPIALCDIFRMVIYINCHSLSLSWEEEYSWEDGLSRARPVMSDRDGGMVNRQSPTIIQVTLSLSLSVSLSHPPLNNFSCCYFIVTNNIWSSY